jgi:hypothetical protein
MTTKLVTNKLKCDEYGPRLFDTIYLNKMVSRSEELEFYFHLFSLALPLSYSGSRDTIYF